MITITCDRGHSIDVADEGVVSLRCSVCGSTSIKFNKKIERTCTVNACLHRDVIEPNKFVGAHHVRGHRVYIVKAIGKAVKKEEPKKAAPAKKEVDTEKKPKKRPLKRRSKSK